MIAYEWALRQAWAVTPEALEEGLAIAARLNDTPEAVAEKLGRPLENAYKVEIRDDLGGAVAVVPIEGPMFKKANLFTRLSGGVSTEILTRDIRLAIDDPSIVGIVLAIDSPGGQATGIAELAEMIRTSRARKPIVAHVDGMGASAAYWIASACSAITCAPTAQLGSIGVVVAMRPPDKGKNAPVEIVSTHAPKKRVDVTTEAGRSEVLGMLDALHDEFETAVARYRGVPRATVRSDFGQGGVLIGKRAVAVGMADLVTRTEDVIRTVAAGQVPGRARLPKSKKTARMSLHRPGEGNRMSWRENVLKALFSGPTTDSDTDDTDDNATASAPTPTPDPDPDPAATIRTVAAPLRLDAATKAKLDRLETLEKQHVTATLDRVTVDAVTFADTAIKENRALPAERGPLAVAFAHAALADAGIVDRGAAFDAATGTVTILAAGTPTDRVASLKAIVAARPTHVLTSTHLAGDHAVVPAARDQAGDTSIPALDKATADFIRGRYPKRDAKPTK